MSQRNPEFHRFDAGELPQVLAAFPFRRQVTAVHLHHTRQPSHNQYRGQETILDMWRRHTQELGWSDIAQHLTIAPDGALWTGRDWNRRPASAKGFNGNADAGPFMIEMIGDFDVGRDRLEGQQRAAVVEVLAQLHEFFDLKDDTLTFHNAMSPKTCPGSAVDRQALLKDVKEARKNIRQETRAAAARGPRPFSDRALAVQRLVAGLTDGERSRALADDPADAELPEAGALPWFEGNGSRDAERARGGFDLTPEVLAELAPHVVNLSDGRLSSSGAMTSEPGQVRAIFEDHLVRELTAAREAKRPLRVVFYLHGGLVNEKRGLATAYKHLAWWRQNGIYPISIVWETGLFETLRSLIFGRRGRGEGARDLVPDRLIEELARRLGGPKVWSGMKRSAERAVEKPPTPNAPPESYGGARFVAELLAEFLKQHPQDDVHLHAVGHSAGAIFHSFFLPALLEEGVKKIDSTHFFAPAITVKDFRQRLARLAGKEIGPVTLFTMKKAFELADEVIEVYDRSLLYLISRALEPERKTPILGLEVSLRDDAEMRKIFALDGSQPKQGEVVFSKTAATTGRSASTATTHGGFDDDAPTMNSLLRRMLDVGDEAKIVEIDPFLEAWESRGGSRGLDVDFEELGDELGVPAFLWSANGAGTAPVAASPQAAMNGGQPAAAGRRRALCVGIDAYPSSPLSGCVADARLWADTLVGLGFETPQMLLDGQATRSAVLDTLERLIADSRAGDVLVFQFSGHGTQLPDVDGDEEDGTDEALCTIDWEAGRALIDDDLAGVFAALPDDVNLTVFLDCCHSGTGTRVAGSRSTSTHPDPTARRRRVVASPEARQRHTEFRRRLGATRGGGDESRGPNDMLEVTFAACQPRELAWESNEQGEFTAHATALLHSNGSMSNEEFERRVQQAFGAAPRQRPDLDCAPAARSRILLRPLGAAAAAPPVSANVPPGLLAGGRTDVAVLLRAVAALVD